MSLTLTIDVSGLTRGLKAVREQVRRELGYALEDSANAVRDEAVRSILHDPKTGRVYTYYLKLQDGKLVRDGKRSTPHRASAPGEAPANDSGYLASNIVAEADPVTLTAGIVSMALYSEDLEYGRGGKYPVEERPFMRPAIEAEREPTYQRVRSAVRRGTR